MSAREEVVILQIRVHSGTLESRGYYAVASKNGRDVLGGFWDRTEQSTSRVAAPDQNGSLRRKDLTKEQFVDTVRN
jgi:hypothetical protein